MIMSWKQIWFDKDNNYTEKLIIKRLNQVTNDFSNFRGIITSC